jgi:hypothetical protein
MITEESTALSALKQAGNDIISISMNCKHSRKIGDNYGLTCQDCGKQLEGYGCGGWFGNNLKGDEACIHRWVNSGDLEEECMYCHRTREREKKAN